MEQQETRYFSRKNKTIPSKKYAKNKITLITNKLFQETENETHMEASEIQSDTY